MKNIIFIGLILLAHFSLAQDNILNNAQFDMSISDWVLGKFNGASAIFSINEHHQLSGTNSAKLNVSNGGTSFSDIQFFQNVELEAYASYSINFMARVNTPKTINLSIRNGFEILWGTEITIDADKTIYGPYNFVSEKFEPGASIVFNIGGNETELLLDSIVINESIPTSVGNDLIAEDIMEVFPNPTQGSFQLLFKKPIPENCSLLISDISGKEIFRTNLEVDTREKYFTVSNLDMTPGIYLIQTNITDITASEKLIVY